MLLHIIPSCLPEINNTLLLKTPHSLNIGIQGINLDMTLKPPSWGLALTVWKVAMKTACTVFPNLTLSTCTER